MKTFIFNFGLVLAQFQLFDDAGDILVDGTQFGDFGFMDAFGPSGPLGITQFGSVDQSIPEVPTIERASQADLTPVGVADVGALGKLY